MAIGDLARKAPPPDKLVKGPPVPGDDGMDMGGGDDDEATEDAVRDGLAEDIIAAGKDPKAFRIALDAYLDSRRE